MAFDINVLQQMGFGRGPGDAKDQGDGTNEKDIVQGLVIGGTDKASGTITKFFGANFSQFGQVSLTQPFDSEGFGGKTIPGLFDKMNMQGGFLVKLLHDIFIKNREITDHTAGVGSADASGSGGGGFDSGGAHHFAAYAASSGLEEMFIAAGGGNHFVHADISPAMLGTLTPSFTPDMGRDRDLGMAA
jgi:hypothetical protein